MKTMKCLVLSTLVIVSNVVASSAFAQEMQNENERVENPMEEVLAQELMPFNQYYGGAALGTIVGFGSGHVIQGRWDETGWKFAAWEAGFLLGGGAVVLTGFGLTAGAHSGGSSGEVMGAVVLISLGGDVRPGKRGIKIQV